MEKGNKLLPETQMDVLTKLTDEELLKVSGGKFEQITVPSYVVSRGSFLEGRYYLDRKRIVRVSDAATAAQCYYITKKAGDTIYYICYVCYFYDTYYRRRGMKFDGVSDVGIFAKALPDMLTESAEKK